MANTIRTIYLLILDPSSNEAEKTINILRNAGHAVRATQIEDEDSLQEALEKQNWDLFLAKPKAKSLNAFQAFKIVQHFGKDLPFVLILNDYSIDIIREALKLGIHAVAPASDQEILRMMILKELEAADDRKGRRKAEHALSEAEIRCKLLLQSSRDAIAYIHDGMHIYTNQAYVELFEYEDQDDIACMPIMDMIDSNYHEGFKNFLRDHGNNSNEEFTIEGIKESGEKFKGFLSISPATYDGEECTQILIRIGSDDAELEKRLKELSAIDQLTGLYNRQSFLEQLTHAVTHAANDRDNFALLCLEVDQWSTVKNDFGIAGTDQLAKQVAKYLKELKINPDAIARISDETFSMIVKSQNPDETKAQAKEICEGLKKQLIDINGRTIPCSLSIGVAFITEKSGSADKVLADAHHTCIRVRKGDGDGVKVYNPAFEQAAGGTNAELVEKIQDALEGGKIFLAFQPVAKLHGDYAEYYQVLLRMENDDGELVPVSEMFPITNQSGLTAKLDRWVIAQSMRIISEQRKSGKKTQFFIELSGGSIVDDSLTTFIQSTLKKSRLPSDALIFQFHETDAAAYLKRAIAFINTVHSLGLKVAMTNFGSSLDPENIFNHLDIDIVFLDGSFTAELFSNQEINEKVQGLIETAHELNKTTVVPNVDEASSLAALYPLGVQYISGDYLHPASKELDYDFEESEF